MGGCTSRSKVLREEFDAPLSHPPVVEEVTNNQEEVTNDVVVVEEANTTVDEVNNASSVIDLSAPDVAIATNILQYLKERVNFEVVTTHYSDLSRLK